MQRLPHTKSCFVCGEANPIGLRLIMETDGQRVHAHFSPGPEHVGFKQTVHGGIISTLLDELMVWACAVQTKQFAYCAELNVRFLQPAIPGQPTLATAELVSNRRGKLFEAQAQLCNSSGTVLATATGKYLPLKGPLLAGMLDDFVGDASAFLTSQ